MGKTLHFNRGMYIFNTGIEFLTKNAIEIIVLEPKGCRWEPKVSHLDPKGWPKWPFPYRRVFTDPTGDPRGDPRGDFRESSQPVLGGVWGGYCLVKMTESVLRMKDRKTLTRSTARRGSAD